MPDLDDLRAQLRRARRDRAGAARRAFTSTERLKRQQYLNDELRRQLDPESEAWHSLLARESELAYTTDIEQGHHLDLVDATSALYREFEPFTDPRHHLASLDNAVPILMFPVRLEVRFKRVEVPESGTQGQLWVRIFPDDCSIDTFDELLTETEVELARDYWLTLWKTGSALDSSDDGVEEMVDERRRGAWRQLMGSFNAGRARWVEQSYQPLNSEAHPFRTSLDETILVIPITDHGSDQQHEALQQYWTAIWTGLRDAGAAGLALEALMERLDLTEDEALALVTGNEPHNLAAELARANPEAPVQVAFLQFPAREATDTKRAAWSRSAEVSTFPERFVLVGYRNGQTEPAIEELGNAIPEPLIVGPSPNVDVEALLVAEFGPETELLGDDEKAELYVEYLSSRSETKWLFDFDAAVEAGMGFKVNLSPEIYEEGFSRLFVAGVRIGADAREGKFLLEELISAHQFGESGFAIVPQGTPTNNTEHLRSGHGVAEDPDEAFDRYHATPHYDHYELDPHERPDGWWLTEALGIDHDRAALDQASGFFGTDHLETQAMNTALFNATAGHFMESMLTPVVGDRQRELVRWMMINLVSGRGLVPAIRIGDQPYGILPVSTVSDLQWLAPGDGYDDYHDDELAGVRSIYQVLVQARVLWQGFSDDVGHVGKQGADAHEVLLQALGLHATSVSFEQRYAQGFDHHYNVFSLFRRIRELFVTTFEERYRRQGIEVLRTFGYRGEADVPILEKFFTAKTNKIGRPLIDDTTLSESDRIRAYTDAGQNYIEWLIANAKADHRNIRSQLGFSENQPPDALLYDLLRHSVNLAFGETALGLYREAELLSDTQVAALRIDAPFIGIAESPTEPESKWDLLYQREPDVVGDESTVVDYISLLLRDVEEDPESRRLKETITALERLKDVPTARLERLMVEHLDCCSYRLDAWLLGLVNLQLMLMRTATGGSAATPADGIPIDRAPAETVPQDGTSAESEATTSRDSGYDCDEDYLRRGAGILLGAYGWLEDVKPDDRTLTAVTLPPDLETVFNPDGDRKITTDSTNAGHVHAPSIDHGLTAAVLRNAYLSNAEEDNAEPFSVNLSSERVRMALSIIEGMQQGQSFGALLGYQLERGMHDRNDEELDIFVHELRKIFPLSSNRLRSTRVEQGRVGATPTEQDRIDEEDEELSTDRAVTKVEARNVVDGLALVEHIKKSGHTSYPFGFPSGQGAGRLKAASVAERAAIDAEVDRLLNIGDAVADVAMAEEVHQVVQGNYDRAAGVLDAFSKGAYPQTPDVISTPTSGFNLTHRVGVHLPADAVPAADANPRAAAEPALNAWVADILPTDPASVVCRVRYRLPDYIAGESAPATEKTVSMADLDLAPIDLLYLLGDQADGSLTALDDHILRFVHTQSDRPRPDAEIEVLYTSGLEPTDGRTTFFQLAALLGSTRSLVETSRPLTPADIAIPDEAASRSSSASGADSVLPPERIRPAVDAVKAVLADLDKEVIVRLAPLVDPNDFEATAANAAGIAAELDGRLIDFVERMRELAQFGFPEAGFGFVYLRLRSLHARVHDRIGERVRRWREKQAAFDDIVNVQVPAASTVEEMLGLLMRAEREVSTDPTLPRPSAVSAYRAIVMAKRADFDAKLAVLVGFLGRVETSLAALLTDATAIADTIALYDFETMSFEDTEREIAVFCEDVLYAATATRDSLMGRMTAADDLLERAATETAASEQVQLVTKAAHLVFGESFLIVPHFTLDEAAVAELQQCLDGRDQLLAHQVDQVGSDFPVDEWLYGVARVREKMGLWENITMLAEAVRDRPSIDLAPIQLPYRPDDHWLALSYPEGREVASDALLYTASLGTGANFVGRQTGLLIDEWTEVIPATRQTTGLTFHFDRPNSEPPQSLLLMTPSQRFRDGWAWDDVLRTLHETLDLARLRAVEPDHIDQSPLARFLPATVSVTTSHPVTMALNYVAAQAATVQEA